MEQNIFHALGRTQQASKSIYHGNWVAPAARDCSTHRLNGVPRFTPIPPYFLGQWSDRKKEHAACLRYSHLLNHFAYEERCFFTIVPLLLIHSSECVCCRIYIPAAST
mmetsp:Transcript_19174/g.44066  ORF Transcript_19174/g.44066 Transcript_19174/m.44066 type:complete len:108 (+) Transcript_19174:229-552(+)